MVHLESVVCTASSTYRCIQKPLVASDPTTSSATRWHPSEPVDIPMSKSPSSSPGAKDIRGPSALIAIDNEPPPQLIVDPPLPDELARGRVFIQYGTENLRVVPVYGTGALSVSPRIGHVHITVDAAPWHFIDSSGETIVLVGLEPGPHEVLIELANPAHQVIASQTVKFTVPVPPTHESR